AEEKINTELERCKLRDLDVSNAEIINKPLNVKPIYKGKLKTIKTSVALPAQIIDDLKHLARVKGYVSFQTLLKEFVSERIFEEKKRLHLF
ncbi:MAG: hypothetical protein V3U15_06170, partial [Nitrospinota bacterium]